MCWISVPRQHTGIPNVVGLTFLFGIISGAERQGTQALSTPQRHALSSLNSFASLRDVLKKVLGAPSAPPLPHPTRLQSRLPTRHQMPPQNHDTHGFPVAPPGRVGALTRPNTLAAITLTLSTGTFVFRSTSHTALLALLAQHHAVPLHTSLSQHITAEYINYTSILNTLNHSKVLAIMNGGAPVFEKHWTHLLVLRPAKAADIEGCDSNAPIPWEASKRHVKALYVFDRGVSIGWLAGMLERKEKGYVDLRHGGYEGPLPNYGEGTAPLAVEGGEDLPVYNGRE